MIRLLAAVATGMLLSGCGATTGTPLADAAEVSASTWVALDLGSGRIVPVTGAVDPADPAWHGSRILFRQLPAGSGPVGRPVAEAIAEADEQPTRSARHDRLWIAALELTQAQWLAMAGSRPWQAVLPVLDQSGWVGDALPAFGLSPRMAEQALADWSRDGWMLDLPEADEWEVACLAGAGTRFAWGDELGAAAAVPYAVCCPADGTLPLPQRVGGRRPNAWGLHDMHGNAWELVRDGLVWQARGGAWDQPVATARASNRIAIASPDSVGWDVGLRPVLRR